MNLQLIGELTKKFEEIQSSTNITVNNINKDTIIPKPPHYFSIATVEGIKHVEKVIHLNIKPENAPASICGDNCATNLKDCRLASECYAMASAPLLSSCSSHAASGAIRRTTSSVTRVTLMP